MVLKDLSRLRLDALLSLKVLQQGTLNRRPHARLTLDLDKLLREQPFENGIGEPIGDLHASSHRMVSNVFSPNSGMRLHGREKGVKQGAK